MSTEGSPKCEDSHANYIYLTTKQINEIANEYLEANKSEQNKYGLTEELQYIQKAMTHIANITDPKLPHNDVDINSAKTMLESVIGGRVAMHFTSTPTAITYVTQDQDPYSINFGKPDETVENVKKAFSNDGNGSEEYIGQWTDNEQPYGITTSYQNPGNPHGLGVMTYANGNTYAGEWVHGQPGGERGGTYTWWKKNEGVDTKLLEYKDVWKDGFTSGRITTRKLRKDIEDIIQSKNSEYIPGDWGIEEEGGDDKKHRIEIKIITADERIRLTECQIQEISTEISEFTKDKSDENPKQLIANLHKNTTPTEDGELVEIIKNKNSDYEIGKQLFPTPTKRTKVKEWEEPVKGGSKKSKKTRKTRKSLRKKTRKSHRKKTRKSKGRRKRSTRKMKKMRKRRSTRR